MTTPTPTYVRYYQFNAQDSIRGVPVARTREWLASLKEQRGDANGSVLLIKPGSDGIYYVGFEVLATADAFKRFLSALCVNFVPLTALPPGLQVRKVPQQPMTPLDILVVGLIRGLTNPDRT